MVGTSSVFVTVTDLLGVAPNQVHGGQRMNPQDQLGVLVNIDANGCWQVQWNSIDATTRQPSGGGTSELMQSMDVLAVS